MNKLIISTLCTLLFSPWAAAQVETTGQRREEPAMQGISAGVANVMLDNESFVKEAALSNLAEIELSNLALRKNAGPAVQSFAQRMLKDHTAAMTDLKARAKSKNLIVPEELDDKNKTVYDQLASTSGAEFDRQYCTQMQQDHDKALALFGAAANDKNLDPQLQQFAQKLLPILRDHQQASHDLLDIKH